MARKKRNNDWVAKRVYKNKICLNCNKEFTPYTSRHKYCGECKFLCKYGCGTEVHDFGRSCHSCSAKNFHAHITKKCKNCSKEFDAIRVYQVYCGNCNFICKKDGCTNIVSGLGKMCASCASKSLRGKPSPLRGRPIPQTQKDNISKGQKGRTITWGDKISKAKKGVRVPEERRKRISTTLKEKWKDPEFAEKTQQHLIAGRHDSPNKLEQYFDSILQEHFPNEWKFVGDWKLVIDGKCPDFVNKDDTKIIELWGNYWHEGENPQKRMDEFKPFGYDTLVLWEHEVNDNIDSCINRVKELIS